MAAPTFVRTIDPPIDLTDNIAPRQIVAESPQEFRIITYPSTAFSQSYINWNIIPPNPQVVIARYFRVQITFTITVNATIRPLVTTPANIINTLYSGLCQYPVHQMINNLTVQFNNNSITIRPNEIIPKLMYYVMDHETQMSTMSTTMAYPDQTQYYSMSDGFVTSPFSSYGDSFDHISRNSIGLNFQGNNTQLQNGGVTNGQVTFKVTVCEPLMMSPLVFDKHWYRRPGITMINNVIINIAIDSVQLQRIWRQSENDLVTYNSVQVSFEQPSLLLYYKTLPVYMTSPTSLSYPFANIQNFIYQYTNQISGAMNTFTLTTNTVQFQTIPHRIIIGVSKITSQKTRNDPDSYYPITNINITWDNRSGILSTLTQYDLYQLCVKNGLKQSWANFSAIPVQVYNQGTIKLFIGASAPLALDFGTDIPLLNEEFPGKKGTWNFQCTITAVNTKVYEANPWLPQIDLIVIYTGRIDIINGTVSQVTGIEPGAAITTFNKVSYPIDVDIYSGGKFDLGSLLASIPGRLLRGVSGLVSGLLGSEEQSGSTGEQGQSKELSLEDLSPALIRQLKRLLRSNE
jgi:hypothetical protein